MHESVSITIMEGGFNNNTKSMVSLHKKWSFPLRNSSVNVTKSVVTSGFGHIYWINPYWKTSFFVQCLNFVDQSVIFDDVRKIEEWYFLWSTLLFTATLQLCFKVHSVPKTSRTSPFECKFERKINLLKSTKKW